jgi:hypothetical protein
MSFSTQSVAPNLNTNVNSQKEYQEKLRKIVYLCFSKIDEINTGTSDRVISFTRYNESKFKSDMGKV